MNVLIVALAVGSMAAAADVVPMLVARSPRTDILSAAVHWIVLGLILAYLDTPFPAWLEGMAVAVLSALPVLILVAPRDGRAVVPMLASSVILGCLSALALGALLP